jgi:hypothetical protein
MELASGRPAMMIFSSLFLTYASTNAQNHKSRATTRGSCHLYIEAAIFGGVEQVGENFWISLLLLVRRRDQGN